MMVALRPLVSEFTLVGRLEDLLVNSKGRVKSLYLSTSVADYSIEVAKEQANVLSKHLKPGCHLKVTGMRKNKLHQDQICYKAYTIELLSKPAVSSSTVVKTNQSTPKILICQGSSCWKKGGKATYELLKAELHAQGMAEAIAIKTTGCLKQCKQAPNLIMPDRHRCSQVKPRHVPQLIAKYSDTTNNQITKPNFS